MLLRSLRTPARTLWSSRLDVLRSSTSRALVGVKAESRQLQPWGEHRTRLFTSISHRHQEVAALSEAALSHEDVLIDSTQARHRAKSLPVSCPGCGALSQTVDSDAAGFYGSKRTGKTREKSVKSQEEDEIFQNAMQSGAMPMESTAPQSATEDSTKPSDVPICDRCHYLRYQSRGSSIVHPSMQSILEIIEESPHKHNHIYHVIDAADFPMSLIPNLTTALQLPRLRTQNRRSKSMHYIRGRQAEVSFIITRSDLLAPKQEQVDALVPYLREVLRDALGRSGKSIRLGNVRCVSAQRGWWTKAVKEDIWNRGGAGWMVGKVNVGKSALYEVVFPKGRNHEEVDVQKIRQREEQKALQSTAATLENHGVGRNAIVDPEISDQKPPFADSPGELSEGSFEAKANDLESFQESVLESDQWDEDLDSEEVLYNENSLLPPAQPETPYPNMPLVSALPGTTASPIRIPFGNGKGELIDLPGVERSSLDTQVKPESRKHLVMRSRVVPEQYTIKPGQSLLIGGLIRITPRTEDLVFLAYPFVPLEAHVTANDKAIGVQTGVLSQGEVYTGNVESIATEEAKQAIQHAGTFKLEWNVTKQRTGSLTDRAAGKQKTANLPFTVYSADILIEGVGWVELTCQVRSRQKSFITETVRDAFGEDTIRKEGPLIPEVEVWTPAGKFVSIRRPMNAWVFGGPKKTAKHARRARPRHSMSFQRRKAGGAMGGKQAAMEEG